MAYTGREKILVNASEITEANIVTYLKKALSTHKKNVQEETYLYKYYKGSQPILNRVKKIRPSINNKIIVNKANEIVSFKTGYYYIHLFNMHQERMNSRMKSAS